MVNYKYCPQCKTNLKPDGGHYYCRECRLKVYVDPNPTAGILPVKGNKVLLAKRAVPPHKGQYDIIGGFLNNGEHPEEAAKREAKEETGLDIKPTQLLGIFTDRYGKGGSHVVNIHYIGKIIKGKMKAQEDVASLHWVPINKIPKTHGFKSTHQSLKKLQEWYKERKKK